MGLKFSICSELFAGSPIQHIFRTSARIGYAGVEIAPFNLAADVRQITDSDRIALKDMASSCGVEIVGTHWLLASPAGLHMTHPDKGVRDRTREHLSEIIKFTAQIGGRTIVIGSPKQRQVIHGVTVDQARDYAKEILGQCCKEAERADVLLCLEPLSRSQTNFINTAEEALALIKDVNHPNMRITLDVYSMSDEGKPLDQIIQSAGQYLSHFHANDTNGRGPGQGVADYSAVVRGLRAVGYNGYASVEVFDRFKDPVAIAADSLDNLKRFFG